MMAGMLTQLPLPLLPAGAAEIAPGVGLVAGEDGGGLVSVHGLATFAWDAGDEAQAAGRGAAGPAAGGQPGAGRGGVRVDPVTVWRWDQALAADGVAGLVPARRGPKGAWKLTPELAARIGELDAAGATLAEIAAATGCPRSVCATRWAGSPPAGSPRRPAWPGSRPPGTVRRARVRRFRCCPIRCRGMASGCWRGGGCWVRAPSRCSRRVPGIRWPGCCWRCRRWRAPACWNAPVVCMAGSATGFTGWARRC